MQKFVLGGTNKADRRIERRRPEGGSDEPKKRFFKAGYGKTAVSR